MEAHVGRGRGACGELGGASSGLCAASPPSWIVKVDRIEML